jgi:hypothetical protein
VPSWFSTWIRKLLQIFADFLSLIILPGPPIRGHAVHEISRFFGVQAQAEVETPGL